MFDLFKRYVDEGYMRFGEGEAWFGRERIIFYFAGFSAREFRLGRKLNGQRYLAYKFITNRREGRVVLRHHGSPDTSKLSSVLDTCTKIIGLFGNGTVHTVKIDEGRGFAVVSGVSMLGLEMKDEGADDSQVDFAIGGFLAGAVQYHSNKPTYAVETSCVAQKGVQECKWIVGSAGDIIDYVRDSGEDVESAEKTLGSMTDAEKELSSGGMADGML